MWTVSFMSVSFTSVSLAVVDIVDCPQTVVRIYKTLKVILWWGVTAKPITMRVSKAWS